VRDTARLSWVW